jgi:nicotinate phosphoribosyltransferase
VSGTGTGGPSTALFTDHYELTMVRAALASGVARHRAVFEVFARALPGGRRVGVVGGTGRLLELLARFRFEPETVAWLAQQGVADGPTAAWASTYRFSGRIDGYAEGEAYFPGSPVLTVEAPFAEAVVLETLVLSVLNFDSAVATTAARMVTAAAGRPLIEMGARRTHEEAAVAAARAAWVAGFAATSDLEAGRRHGLPTAGTAAHAFVLAHRDEEAAFAAQVAALGPGTTLLVDTYDPMAGVERAVAAAGTGLGAVRLDSGDLARGARDLRRRLDELGARGTRIVLSGDLDEERIAALVADGVPADAFGIGTRLVAEGACPPPGFVYKLVAVADRPGEDAPLRPVAKAGGTKATRGGRKTAWRRRDPTGRAEAELVAAGGPPPPPPGARPLQVPLWAEGAGAAGHGVEAARASWGRARAELPEEALSLTPGPPGLPTVHLGGPPA